MLTTEHPWPSGTLLFFCGGDTLALGGGYLGIPEYLFTRVSYIPGFFSTHSPADG